MPTSDQPERTALYRFFSADEQLLYVGITNAPDSRWRQHAAVQPWWPEVSRKTLTWFDTREAAAQAEAQTIRDEKPTHNHVHNPSTILGRLTGRVISDGPNAQPSPWRPFRIVANDLRDLIQHDMRPGDKLPTTGQLMEAYGVSNPTVQKALLVLKDEGFAVGKPGSAVYAALPPQYRREPADREGDGEGDIELLLVQMSKPSPRTCKALHVERGTEVQERRWLRCIDGVPVELVRSFQHPAASQGETPCRIADVVTADVPTPYEVETLRMVRYDYVLSILRATFNEADRPIRVQEITKVGRLNTVEYRY